MGTSYTEHTSHALNQLSWLLIHFQTNGIITYKVLSSPTRLLTKWLRMFPLSKGKVDLEAYANHGPM